MIPILLIAFMPFLIAILGLIPPFARRLPKLAAALMLAQLPLVIGLLIPVFQGEAIAWGPFGIDGIGAAFTCITTLVVSASMVQAAFLLPAEREDRPMSDRRFGLYYTLIGFFILAMYAFLI